MKVLKYSVETADGKPCVLDAFKTLDQRGILRVCRPGEQPTNFGDYAKRGGIRAQQAIARSMKLREKLSTPSLFDDWDKLGEFTTRLEFVVKKTPSETKRRGGTRKLAFA